MSRAEDRDRLAAQIVVVPHRWRGGPCHDIQTKAQDRIGVALRAMYTDLLQQPLSPQLAKLVSQIRTQPETFQHAG